MIIKTNGESIYYMYIIDKRKKKLLPFLRGEVQKGVEIDRVYGKNEWENKTFHKVSRVQNNGKILLRTRSGSFKERENKKIREAERG